MSVLAVLLAIGDLLLTAGLVALFLGGLLFLSVAIPHVLKD